MISFTMQIKQIIQKYPVDFEKIIFGFNSDLNIIDEKNIVNELYNNYNFAGVFNWEYFNSPPMGKLNPYKWALEMKDSMKPKHYFRKIMEIFNW